MSSSGGRGRTKLMDQVHRPNLVRYPAPFGCEVARGRTRYVASNTAAVVLAAGASTRYGGPKQVELLPSVLAALSRTSIGEVVVVEGAHPLDELCGESARSWRVVRCESWERGPGASLRCGLAALGPEVSTRSSSSPTGPSSTHARWRDCSPAQAASPCSPRATTAHAATPSCSPARPGHASRPRVAAGLPPPSSTART